MRLGVDPFSVLPVFAFLGNLANIDLGIEIGCKGFAMVAGIAINNIEIMKFIKVVPGRVGSKYRGYPGSNPQPSIAVNPAFLYLS